MNTVLSKIKYILKSVKVFISSCFKVFKGVLIHETTGVNTDEAYQSMIGLYCLTNGYSNIFLSWLVKFYKPKYKFLNFKGVLGDLTPQQINQVIQAIQKNGYYIFEELMPVEMCEKLISVALTQECNLTGTTDVDIKVSKYNIDCPIATTYWLREEDLIANPDIQSLMMDLSILAIAQAYLETAPILDIVAMWWSTSVSKNACTASAQLYHFDMDRIKWLKFFVYLTDVTTDTGPHCYIAGSHKPNNKPRELLERGYARISNEDIMKFYPQSDFIEVTAPKGTIIAGDTSCFHKGKPLKTGQRLTLQLEFTNSLFGGSYLISCLDKSRAQNLSKFAQIYRRIYSTFHFR